MEQFAPAIRSILKLHVSGDGEHEYPPQHRGCATGKRDARARWPHPPRLRSRTATSSRRPVARTLRKCLNEFLARTANFLAASWRWPGQGRVD